MKKTKRFALLLISLFSFSGNAQSQQKSKPNIVLIFADDLGWTDVSTGNTNFNNGSKIYQTPQIAQLASEGMSFTNAYTNQNCAPSRAALISGQYATGVDNGVYNVGSLYRPDKRTKGFPNLPIKPHEQQNVIADVGTSIFDVLKNQGYTTALIGKSHGTPHPLKAGYGIDLPADIHHEIKVMVNGKKTESSYLALKSDKNGWTFDSEFVDKYANPYNQEYIDKTLSPYKNNSEQSVLMGTPKHLTDAIGDYAVDYIKEKARGENPFFLYVPFHAVHSDVVGRKDLTEKYLKKGLSPRLAEYGSLIELLDQNVGKINKALKDPNGDGDLSDDITNNTIFIFYSDNGGLVDNVPLKGKKGSLDEGGIRVPLIFRYPGVIKQNSISNQAVHCIDFIPTLADMAGASVTSMKKNNGEKAVYDGASFASILKGNKKCIDRENLFWHLPGYMDERFRPTTLIQKRIGKTYYKLFYYYETEEFTLYNLNKDLEENNNLLKNPSAKDMKIALKMNADMVAWLKANKAPTGTFVKDGAAVLYPKADGVNKYNQ
ncbi:sulfatase-like hydrolase/transferase [Flavobacterium sp. NG2]|uniref:sulfatase-like hydrolase/transferase n=1 Tax=Flavobacterium sp. NG2 TaxID=3097547 RepID=UPI002A80FEA7|nr:sulfatase-like hydrolase/transferase [Flavobacterium sp. NG2]WPR70130.1 sulfatase-like hydrolase/transferase [Flavobacterium sp. NG2]